jgi:hypothetical protein
MPLQNRVHPNGELFAVPERGTMLGNRGGKFHRDDKTLSKRRWASRTWIACELHYKNWHHEPMGQGYTSLFFLDEVTALSTGHRPCFLCRRAQAKRFVELSGMGTQELDRLLHGERVTGYDEGTSSVASRQLLQRRCEDSYSLLWREGARAAGVGREVPLPDGAMVEVEGTPHAIKAPHLLRWSFAGYTATIPTTSVRHANLLTPPTIVGILAKGYQPRWHLSALQWETS